MLGMHEQELQGTFEVDGTHQLIQTHQQHPHHTIHQVQLLTEHELQQHSVTDSEIVVQDNGNNSTTIPLHTVHAHDPHQQHTTHTHTIRLHSSPTQLIEILVSSAPHQDSSSPHEHALTQTIDLQPSIDSSNQEIVVVSHDMNGLEHHETHRHHIDTGNEIVTVSVPITNGNTLQDHTECELGETKLLVATMEDIKPLKHETDDQSNGLEIHIQSQPGLQSHSLSHGHLELEIDDSKINHELRPRRKTVQSRKTNYDFDVNASLLKGGVENDSPDEDDIEMNMIEETVITGEADQVGASDLSDSDDGEGTEIRKCVVCLRQRKFTEDIYDPQKQVFYHVDVLLAHLNIQLKNKNKSPKSGKGALNTGVCPECMDHLQRWHIFNCAIVKRHEAAAEGPSEKFANEPIPYECFEARVYRNYKKMGRVKEVFLGATHAHYARRHLTEKDWDFFCDHLFHSNSVKSEKSRELERFLTSREKLSQLFCIKCNKLIANGKKGYTRHMQTEHDEIPVMYPCDICGNTFPEKDMTASTEDYYPHWIAHFYFNKCDDCGKRFPTKRALGQHRHAVHKNRQVKCEKCGKVLANKMSLDLHLLRHLPENEKKKYMMKCKVCKKKIAQWNLKSHMATHNDDRPWKCDHCDATFKMKGALVSHRDVVHFNLKNHVCSICNEAFKSASSLRGHVRRHEGRKDYKCDVCLKEYYTYSALKGHKVVHQTARDFICEICGKAFKKKKALEEHGTIHTGEKPHQCPICGREIRVKSNLYKHMKIHKKNPGDGSTPAPRRRNQNASAASSASASNVSNPTTTVTNTATKNNNNSRTNTNSIGTNNASNRVSVSVLNNGSGGNSNLSETLAPTSGNSLLGGNEGMSSVSNTVEITDNSVLSNNSVQSTSQVQVSQENTMEQVQSTTYLTPTFQSNNHTTLVHTITMPHQHQDLLSVPVQTTHFYNAPQYFGALDPL